MTPLSYFTFSSSVLFSRHSLVTPLLPSLAIRLFSFFLSPFLSPPPFLQKVINLKPFLVMIKKGIAPRQDIPKTKEQKSIPDGAHRPARRKRHSNNSFVQLGDRQLILPPLHRFDRQEYLHSGRISLWYFQISSTCNTKPGRFLS